MYEYICLRQTDFVRASLCEYRVCVEFILKSLFQNLNDLFYGQSKARVTFLTTLNILLTLLDLLQKHNIKNNYYAKTRKKHFSHQ